MKKLLFLALLLTTAFGVDAVAQDFKANTGQERPTNERKRSDADHAERIAAQVDQLTQGLKLDAEQVTAVTAIMTKTFERRSDMRGQARGGDRSAMREQMKKMMAEQDAEIEAILDKKQLRRYENMKAQRKQRGPRGGGRPGGGRPGGENPEGGR